MRNKLHLSSSLELDHQSECVSAVEANFISKTDKIFSINRIIPTKILANTVETSAMTMAASTMMVMRKALAVLLGIQVSGLLNRLERVRLDDIVTSLALGVSSFSIVLLGPFIGEVMKGLLPDLCW